MTEENRKPNVTCNICSKAIYRRSGILTQSGGKAYCSQKCFGKSCRREIPCVVCGKMMLSGANKKTCTRACSNKNRTGILYKSTGRPLKDKVKTYYLQKKRLMSSRGKMCERCSYDIYQILQVHHRDKNRKNNNQENLELLCPNCHAKEHYLKK